MISHRKHTQGWLDDQEGRRTGCELDISPVQDAGFPWCPWLCVIAVVGTAVAAVVWS